MSLGDELKTKIRGDLLAARKARSRDVDVLSTLVGEIEKGEKSGKMTGREDTIAAVKKILNGINETLAVSGISDEARAKMLAEKSVLEAYMPAQMSEADLTDFVRDQIAASNLAGQHVGKATGVIMGALKAQRAGQFDGSFAAEIVKREMAVAHA